MFRQIKKYFSPVQMQLLKRGMCVACLMPLKNSKDITKREDGNEIVTCKCGRIFIYKNKDGLYRRAELNEV